MEIRLKYLALADYKKQVQALGMRLLSNSILVPSVTPFFIRKPYQTEKTPEK